MSTNIATATGTPPNFLRRRYKGAIDYVLVNSAPLSKEFFDANNAAQVAVDEDKINAMGMGLIKADLISDTDAGRHAPDKLCKAVIDIIYKFGKRH